MNQYSVYDTETNLITRIVTCSDNMIAAQLQENESYVLGAVNQSEYYVNTEGTDFVAFTETEQNYNLYLKRQNSIPPGIDISLTDAELNTYISDYFLEYVDVSEWRITNYEYLRKLAYPEATEKNDADVKIASGITEYVTEGTLQLAQYNEDCINVKIRFQKE